MLVKLNFVTVLAAAVLFLFPWLDVRCSGETIFKQSGMQAVYGGGTGYHTKNSDPEPIAERVKESGRPAFLVVIALLAVLAAVFFAARSFFAGSISVASGGWCCIALICLIIQAAVRFPIEKDFGLHFIGGSPPDGLPGVAELQLNGAIAREVRFHYAPAFFLEIAALSIPAFIFFSALLDRFRKSGAV